MGKVIQLFRGDGGEPQMERGVLDAREVAKVFLHAESMSNKKLQKLCYYAQAWHYALYKKGLFYQDIEAWVHGPVVPDVYYKYNGYRWNDIPNADIEIPDAIDRDVLEFLNSVYNTYCEFSGDQLEALTHSEKPWQVAREGYEEWEPSHELIDPEIMSSYYWGIYEAGQQ